eukprot:735626-Prymnesium_polylepis.1
MSYAGLASCVRVWGAIVRWALRRQPRRWVGRVGSREHGATPTITHMHIHVHVLNFKRDFRNQEPHAHPTNGTEAYHLI